MHIRLIIRQLHIPLFHILTEVQNDQNLISLLLGWLYDNSHFMLSNSSAPYKFE